MLELQELRELFAAGPATCRATEPTCRMSYGEIEAAVLARRKLQSPTPDSDVFAAVTSAAGEAASTPLAGAQATAERLAKLGASSPPGKGKSRAAGSKVRGVRRAAPGRRVTPTTPLHALMPLDVADASEALLLACCAHRRSPDGRHREVPEPRRGHGGPTQHPHPARPQQRESGGDAAAPAGTASSEEPKLLEALRPLYAEAEWLLRIPLTSADSMQTARDLGTPCST